MPTAEQIEQALMLFDFEGYPGAMQIIQTGLNEAPADRRAVIDAWLGIAAGMNAVRTMTSRH